MRNIEFIVLHYTASVDVGRNTINSWHQARGWNEIGYHFVVRKNGRIEEGRDISKVGAHTRGYNKDSIGIVLTGSNDLAWYPTNKQIVAAKVLIAALRSAYAIPQHKVYLHRELGSTACPGRLSKSKLLEGSVKKVAKKVSETDKATDWVKGNKILNVVNDQPISRKDFAVALYRYANNRKRLFSRLFRRK